ncbi:MAG: hypothetical protein ACYDAD_04105 [Acidimicrobiales bacterium]
MRTQVRVAGALAGAALAAASGCSRVRTQARTRSEPTSLAYVDAGGLKVSDLAGHTTSLGPSDSTGLSWSPRGHRLGWVESGALVVADLDHGSLLRWPGVTLARSALRPPTVDWTSQGATVLGPSGVTVYRYDGTVGEPRPVGDQGRTVVPADGAGPSTEPVMVVGSRSSGLIVVSPASQGPWLVAEVSTTGAFTRLAELPGVGPSPLNPPYSHAALDPSGSRVIFEQGDHTDGCGIGRSSSLVLAELATGEVAQIALPIPPKGRVFRVASLAWGPDGQLDATTTDCPAVGTPTSPESVHPTTFWERTNRGWRKMRDDVIAARRGPGGLLAVVSGHFVGRAQAYAPTGEGALSLLGPSGPARLVAHGVGAEAFAFAPGPDRR